MFVFRAVKLINIRKALAILCKLVMPIKQLFIQKLLDSH